LYISNYNLIIEVLGNYWHKCFICNLKNIPMCENIEDRLLNVLKKDIEKDEIYKSLGFNVLYVFESDFENECWKENLIERIEQFKP